MVFMPLASIASLPEGFSHGRTTERCGAIAREPSLKPAYCTRNFPSRRHDYLIPHPDMPWPLLPRVHYSETNLPIYQQPPTHRLIKGVLAP